MGIEDRTGNQVEDMKGKAKEHTGRVTGNEDMKREGRKDQASASMKDAKDKAKGAADDAKDAFRK